MQERLGECNLKSVPKHLRAKTQVRFPHRYLINVDCLSFVVCPLLVPHLPRHFPFLLQPLTVLMKQTRQAVRAIKQSILLRCLWFSQNWIDDPI
jgi:hypothetical protein